MSERQGLTTRGQRARWLREEVLDLTTAELAERLADEGVRASDATVSRYETGKREPSLEYLVTLAEIAGASLDWLMYGRGAAVTSPLEVVADVRRFLDHLEARLSATAGGEDGVAHDALAWDEAQAELEEEARRQRRGRGTGG